ncbi:MAG: DNA methyltransferase [Bacilli bacterium]
MLKKNIIECESLPIDIENGAEYIIMQQKPNTFTHGYFKYPCKFIPEIPKWYMSKYLKKNERILDPFAGSGTTVLEAAINNIESVGIEISKLSELLIKVKTTLLSENESIEAYDFMNNICFNIELTYPNIDNIHHWFEEDNLKKLIIIKQNINNISNVNVRNFLDICFISIVRKCSRADSVSPKPYISTKINKKKYEPYDEFGKTLKLYINKNKELKDINYKNNLATIIRGDATRFSLKEQFNGAITSPPYINAFDYVRILKLETLWLGLSTENELRSAKKEYVGTENLIIKDFNDYSILDKSELLHTYYKQIKTLDNKRAHIVLKFFNDMYKNLLNVYEALSDNSTYGIVIGNSKIRGVEVESWKVISEISKYAGFYEELNFSYQIRNHYLRIDRKGKGGKINSDYVLILRK